VDSITQAALGGVVGELVLGRKLGWKGMAWGLFFGTLPDLDILVYPWLDQAEKLRWHRGISHSIAMMLVASFTFAKPLSLLHRKKGVSAKRAGWFVFLAWSTHVLIDVFTSYGTQVFEPFSDQRVAWSNIFIIDLFFTLPLLICVLYWPWKCFVYLIGRLRWRRGDQDPEEKPDFPAFSTRCAKMAIFATCLYVVFSLVMKLWAVDQIKGHMADELPNGKVVMVAPTPFNTLLWRGLIETDEAFFVTYWSPFDREPAKYDFLPRKRSLATSFDGKEPFETLKWFSRGYWIARQGPEGKVIFIDVRFGELRDVESKQQLPMFQWHLEYDEDGKLGANSYRPRDLKMQEALGLIWRRIWGNKEEWESIKSF
tara:strand:- start:15 stop:1121 length:1107 start_codon:yes stop_codon:yes gene_type:complete